jgi:predicted ATP-grasp superfamily ATP-dependent carboligase
LSFGLKVDLRRLNAARPPVLLLGGLDLLRPLGFAGIPAIVASPEPNDVAFGSRYCSGRCLLPPLSRRDAVVETLLAAGQRLAGALGRAIPLFYGNDHYLNLVCTARDDLWRSFLLLLNEPDLARALIDKGRFEKLARERGLPAPRTLAWAEAGADALGGAAGPVIAKPRVKSNWEESPVLLALLGAGGKARIFASGAEAMAHPLARRLRDQLTFQEYIPGGDQCLWSYHGFADEKGEVFAWFVGHKLRTFPALTGTSTYLELARDEELAAIGRDTAARLALKGVFKIDLKRSAADGRSRVLEINARYNLWHHLAARNGVNLPKVAYDYLVHGLRPAGTRCATSFRWLYFRLDVRAFRELASRRELSLGAWLLSLLASRKVCHVFSWTDPIPFLCYWRERLKTRLQREIGRLKTGLQRWLSTAF